MKKIFKTVINSFFKKENQSKNFVINPSLKKDEVYEKHHFLENKIRISKVLFLLSNYQVLDSGQYFYTTPKALSIDKKTAIWIDEINKLIGFSNKKRSLILPVAEIINFEITNILPAKGSGGSYLSVNLKNEKYNLDLSISAPKDFDKYANDIFKTTGIQVTFSPEFYDC